MSSPHGGLDDQIERLMQCKPLAEPEVTPFSSPSSRFEVPFHQIWRNCSAGGRVPGEIGSLAAFRCWLAWKWLAVAFDLLGRVLGLGGCELGMWL